MSQSKPNDELFAALLARAETRGTAQQLRDVIEALSAESDQTRAALGELLDLLQTSAEEVAPPELVERALARVRELEAVHPLEQGARVLRERAGSVRRKVREIVATLVLDSYAGAALPGIRGAARLQPRQLMYEAPQGTVHLQVESEGGQIEILGQFLPTDGSLEQTTVHLQAGDHSSTVELGETGEFAFSSVPSDRVEIEIRTKDHLLTLAPIDPIQG